MFELTAKFVALDYFSLLFAFFFITLHYSNLKY